MDKLYSTKQVALSVFGQKVHESSDKIEQMVNFIEKLLQSASTKDVLLFQSSLEQRMAHLVSSLPQLDLASTVQLEFISNFQAIQVGVRNQFGYIKSGSEGSGSLAKQPPISRPVPTNTTTTAPPATPGLAFSQFSNSVMSGLTASSTAALPSLACSVNSMTKDYTSPLASLDFQNNCLLTTFGAQQSEPPVYSQQPPAQIQSQASPLEILENLTLMASGSTNSLPSSSDLLLSSLTGTVPQSTAAASSLATPVPSAPIAYPPKAQIRRQKMIYHCKFGEFGILEGQFTEPSGGNFWFFQILYYHCRPSTHPQVSILT